MYTDSYQHIASSTKPACYIGMYSYSYSVIFNLFQLQTVQTVLPYHRIMTPSYLIKHATITGPYVLTPQYLEISSTTGDMYQRGLKIQLVAPDILTNADCVGITVIIAFDTKLADNDFDPRIGITDGINFNGFVMGDGAYTRPIDGKSGKTFSKQVTAGNKINAPKFPAEIKMQFKPLENWGSAYDNSYTTIGNYQNTLDLTKGLYLEMYRDHIHEKYHIRYITVDVSLD